MRKLLILTIILFVGMVGQGEAKHSGWIKYHPVKKVKIGIFGHPLRLYQRHYKYHWAIRKFAGPCLSWIIDREDFSWNPQRWNTAGSGAYGLPQALPGSKMASAGRDWRTNPFTQIRWMRGYVKRYGGECAARNFWVYHHSY